MKTKNQIVEILNKYNLLIDENTGQCAISDSDFDRIADEILQQVTKDLTAEEIPYKVNQDVRKVLLSITLNGYDVVCAESDIIKIIKNLNESKRILQE
jgi:hypothetical protein